MLTTVPPCRQHPVRARPGPSGPAERPFPGRALSVGGRRVRRMTGLDRLLALVPPPASPVGADADWSRTERQLGLALPTDFTRTVRRYGDGVFCDDLYMYSPHHMAEINLGLLAGWSDMREQWPEEVPYPLHPEPGGLVVWGGDSAGGALCWITEGEPDGWETVHWQQRDGEFTPAGCGAPELLARLLERRVAEAAEDCEEFDGPWFTPLRERVHVCLRLTEGPLPYAERLRLLRERLAPVQLRGGWANPDGARQDHFAATPSLWEITYETAYGHQIRITYPPAEEERVRTELLAAVGAMGCSVESGLSLDRATEWPEFAGGGSGTGTAAKG